MANMTDELRTRLKQITDAMQVIEDKGASGRTDDDNASFGNLIMEGRAVRSQLEQSVAADELRAFAGSSAGMLPLSGPAHADPVVNEMATRGTTLVRDHTPPQPYEQTERGRRVFDTSALRGFSPEMRTRLGSDEYHEVFENFLRVGPGRYLEGKALRTLQEAADPSGGYLVPEEILNRVIAKEPTPTRVAAQVTQLQASRDALTIPKVVWTTDDLYTTGMKVQWTGENPAAATTARVTDPVFGQVRIPVYTAMMSLPLTNDLLEDAAFPLLSWVSDKFGETIDLLRDNMILNGTGIGQPSGILVNPGATNNPAVIKTGASAALGAGSGSAADAAAAKKLISVAMTLPEQYQDNARWVMNLTNTANAIAQLADGNSRPFWGAGVMDAGLENGYLGRRLVGMPVVFSGFMPNIGASTYPLIFGDLRAYYLVNRIGFSLQFLRELYAETNQIVVLGRIRFGGQVVEDWKLKVVQAAA